MKKDIPVDEIKSLADDVRLIKDFAENHNFDSSLLRASVSPKKKSSFDMPLICLSFCIMLLILTIAVMKFSPHVLSIAASNFIFVLGLIFVVLAAMAAHMKFKDKFVTSIAGIGLLMVLFIGAGVFTPEQAVEKASAIAK